MSLQDRSILIDISLSCFTTTRTDAFTTGEVLQAKSAQGDAGRWVNNILPKECTKALSSLDGQIRKFHRTNTLPWSDKNGRILPSANFDSYMERIREFRREREALVVTFKRLYPTYLNQARREKGALFDPGNYPSADVAADMYELHISALPIPHENDFRCQLNSPAEMEEIQRNLRTQIKSAEQNAAIELFQRICNPLANMIERLSDPDATFKDSLVSNLEEITDLIPRLNLTDNPKLAELHTTIKAQLGHYTPDALRHSKADRSAAATKAQAIFSQAQAWMNPAQAA
jgi:hypothetical protein